MGCRNKAPCFEISLLTICFQFRFSAAAIHIWAELLNEIGIGQRAPQYSLKTPRQVSLGLGQNKFSYGYLETPSQMRINSKSTLFCLRVNWFCKHRCLQASSRRNRIISYEKIINTLLVPIENSIFKQNIFRREIHIFISLLQS